ncbi:MAG: hypothetical protein ACREI3_01090 [Nitrospirales bacterium]
MPITQRDFGKQAIHDHVVRLVAQQWAASMRYRMDANPGLEENAWAGSSQTYPDLVGWTRQGRHRTPVLIAEVETEETVNEIEAKDQWRLYGKLGVPFYLIVPRGYGVTAQRLARRVGVTPCQIYEYAFINRTLLLA